MPSVTMYITGSTMDWDTINSTNTTLTASWDSGGAIENFAFAKMTSSSIPSDATITGGTFYWYHHSYTKNKSDSFYRYIESYNSSSYNSLFLDSSGTPSSGWNSVALNSAAITNLQNYGTGSTGWFQVRFSVGTPTVRRIWNIRAWDYTGDNTNAPYVVVEYDEYVPPATGRKQRFFVIG